MIPDYHFHQDESTEVIGEEGVIASNCADIHFTNRSSFDIYVEHRRVATDETYSIAVASPLIVNKKKYSITYKRVVSLIDKTPFHPTVKLEVKRIYYKIIPGQLTTDAYKL